LPDRPADPESGHWVVTTTTAISRGDRAALAALYEVWFDRCYALARTLTGRDESFCLDVVQDAMLRVIRSIKPLSTQSDLSAWMTRVVHTAALDLLRRESRRLKRESARTEAGSSPSTAATEDRIAWVLAQLNELSPADRSLIGLRLGQGRTLEAVGAAAGMTGDAVHGRIRRAIAKLKRRARENAHDE